MAFNRHTSFEEWDRIVTQQIFDEMLEKAGHTGPRPALFDVTSSAVNTLPTPKSSAGKKRKAGVRLKTEKKEKKETEVGKKEKRKRRERETEGRKGRRKEKER